MPPSSRALFCNALLLTLLSPALSLSQSGSQSDRPQEGGQPPARGGVNTGTAHAATFDQQHRPITAGGFVKTGPTVFEDISQKSGLATWTHTMGTPQKRFV